MKHIHFIGICGVAMSGLAIAFQKKGYRVSGSDAGFYPPVSTMLEKNSIEFYPGWHPEKMGIPDLVVVGNVASSTNPEWLAVQTKKIPYQSYPETIADFFIKENSIVCAGTYGKTTAAALLSWIFTRMNLKPNYMFGGLAVNDFPSAKLDDSDWSIVEGDEYKSARWDNGAKFNHYNPKYLLLSAVSWDHADVYPTEARYIDAFKDLVKKIPKQGIIAVCNDNAQAFEIARKYSGAPVIEYGSKPNTAYSYDDVTQTPSGILFTISHNEKKYPVKCPLIGTYQAENITGAFALASELLQKPFEIAEAIAEFPGLRRRLEKRFEGSITVFDDIAHSPAKARSVLSNLRKIYSGKITTVFEPNTGNRRTDMEKLYDRAFVDADEILIPRLTKVKIDMNDSHPPSDGETLARVIANTHSNVHYIDDDERLINHLLSGKENGNVIVFLGSHGFRGMIDDLISKLNNENKDYFNQ